MIRNAALYWPTFLPNDLPASSYHNDGNEGVEDDEQHRDPVDAQVVIDVEARIHGFNSTNCIPPLAISKLQPTSGI